MDKVEGKGEKCYYYNMRIKVLALILLFGLVFGITPQEEKILLKDVAEIKATLKVFMEQVDKRFEQVDKRFGQVDKRFEQVDKRFEELRQDMNKRFEQVDRRFDQMTTFLWIIVAIFTSLTAVVIGFAYWDRRTIIRKARDEAVERIDREGRWKDLLNALIELSKTDERLASVLRRFHLL